MAAIVNDPLFGGDGEAVDPGLLLTPSAGKRARVSVISFVGLPSDDQRQSFVNQLQMALFAWIKKNPAGDRPLGGLFVMDEAQTLAPAGAMTACTLSTIKLASQARKYGLGLVFATQAPKGLHNQIPGNAATQFFGFLNSPVQIAAAREMAQAKGGDVLDISRLRAGQFYAASEGLAFQKLQIPLCLSHHPTSALTAEEVISRACGGSAKSAPLTEIKSAPPGKSGLWYELRPSADPSSDSDRPQLPLLQWPLLWRSPAPKVIAGRTSARIGFLDIDGLRQPVAGTHRLVDETNRLEACGRCLINHAERLATALRRDGILKRPKIVANRHDLRHRRFDPYRYSP
jgi:hypothetical protein